MYRTAEHDFPPRFIISQKFTTYRWKIHPKSLWGLLYSLLLFDSDSCFETRFFDSFHLVSFWLMSILIRVSFCWNREVRVIETISFSFHWWSIMIGISRKNVFRLFSSFSIFCIEVSVRATIFFILKLLRERLFRFVLTGSRFWFEIRIYLYRFFRLFIYFILKIVWERPPRLLLPGCRFWLEFRNYTFFFEISGGASISLRFDWLSILIRVSKSTSRFFSSFFLSFILKMVWELLSRLLLTSRRFWFEIRKSVFSVYFRFFFRFVF